MKNKLLDLNNHLFAQLERLGEEDLKGAELTINVRAKSQNSLFLEGRDVLSRESWTSFVCYSHQHSSWWP